MSENTENFIETVRKYVFLYETRHEYYKNVLKKAEARKEIAENLDMTIESAKQKWKNLRDSNLRNKKFIKGETGQSKKYHKWPWSSHMEFLDYTFKPRSHSSNVSQSLTDTEENEITDADNLPITEDGRDTNALAEKSPTLPEQSLTRGKITKSRCPAQNNADVVDKVINFLENKKRKQDLDGIDHLFLSYADTFKKWHPMTQAKMKLELATLFARTEINELNAQSPPALSPTYFQSSSVSSSHTPQYSNSSTQTFTLASPTYHTLPCSGSGESSHQSTDHSILSARDVHENASDMIQNFRSAYHTSYSATEGE